MTEEFMLVFLALGLLFFAYKSKMLIFNFFPSVIFVYLAFEFSDTIMLMIIFLGLALGILFMTFFGPVPKKDT